jgi:galactokinase
VALVDSNKVESFKETITAEYYEKHIELMGDQKIYEIMFSTVPAGGAYGAEIQYPFIP